MGAEMFRPMPGGEFRSATAKEIRPQLAICKGYAIRAFDASHYVSDTLMNQLRQR